MKQIIKHKKKSFIQESILQVFPVLHQEKMQSFIIIVLTMLAIIIFGLFAISPTVSTILQLRKQLADDTFVSKALQKKIDNHQILKEKYITMQPDLPLVLAAIPDAHKTPELIGQLQGLAKKQQVTVIAVETEPIIISSPGKQIAFSFTIEGKKERLLAVIRNFTSFDRITTIDEILLQNQITQDGEKIQATIKGIAYFKSL